MGWKEAAEHVRTGPHYLEGWLGNEAVEITNRGGDIHRNGPLLLRWGCGELWQGYNCGCFLEKSGLGVIYNQKALHYHSPQKMLQSFPQTQPNQATLPVARPLLSCLHHREAPTFNTRSSKLLIRAKGALQGEAETLSSLVPPGCPTASLSNSSPPPKSRGSSRRLRLNNPGAGAG